MLKIEGSAQILFMKMIPIIVILLFSISSISGSSNKKFSLVTEHAPAIKQAVSNAVTFLRSQRHEDYGWGNPVSTSRANVAMMFSDKVQPVDEDEKKLMKKRLNIQMSLDMISNSATSLSHLALYINAMYATCQNPRNFQGMDLVSLLRSQTDTVMGSKFSLPLVLMTLCIANETGHFYGSQLIKIYNAENRISTRALTVLAMECMKRKSGANLYSDYIKHFFTKVASLQLDNLDVHTKALVAQAAYATGSRIKSFGLLSHQDGDGSFGDLLATYYAIPALLKSSLLDLKCKHPNEDEGMVGSSLTELNPKEKKVMYSLWITSGNDVSTHSMVITYTGNKTFYDIMKMAESRNPMYRFICDQTVNGKEAYSLADIPNDTEMGMSWKLYHTTSEGVSINSWRHMQELKKGVDTIIPLQNSHFIFWLKQS